MIATLIFIKFLESFKAVLPVNVDVKYVDVDVSVWTVIKKRIKFEYYKTV